VVLANGSMSSTQNGEDDIRRTLVEADVIDCMIALPGQLFYSTQIPACLWFLARNKNPGGNWRDRRGEVLFIDARKLGHLVDRTRREFSDEDIAKVATAYHAWRGETTAGKYEDIPGFCKGAPFDLIRTHNHVLTPGRYVGSAALDEEDIPFTDRFALLTDSLQVQFAESQLISERISQALARISPDE
jgi:type I restriction enzyme M protein